MRNTWPLCTWVETMRPAESNFTESGTPRPVATVSGAPPSRSMRQISLAPITGKYSKPVRADLHRVGGRDILQQHPRRATAQVKLEQAPALPTFADKQPALVDGDPVGGRDIVAQHPGAAIGAARADPTVHDLGGVEVAARVESHVVGRDDVAALGADGFQPAGFDVEGTDLAAGHLRDVDPAVGAGP